MKLEMIDFNDRSEEVDNERTVVNLDSTDGMYCRISISEGTSPTVRRWVE